MNQFLPVYQIRDGSMVLLNIHLITRIEPTSKSNCCDYNIYMINGFQLRVHRIYQQNKVAIEMLDAIYLDSTRGEDL